MPALNLNAASFVQACRNLLCLLGHAYACPCAYTLQHGPCNLASCFAHRTPLWLCIDLNCSRRSHRCVLFINRVEDGERSEGAEMAWDTLASDVEEMEYPAVFAKVGNWGGHS